MHEGADPDATDPTVSVVIPTYGRAEQLPGAIETVANQTYEQIELLVVDDGSPEPVADIVDTENVDGLDSIEFLRHDENRGANVARNTGIKAATGTYVAFLDDDDRWHEEKISRQVETFEAAPPSVGVTYTGKRAEGPDGTTVTNPTASGDVLPDLLTGESFGQFSSVMVRADVIDTAGLPDERFPAWQDREWFFRLAQHCEFEPISETLTYRHVGLPDSITRQFEQKRDVAYPLFVEKHYSLAKSYGRYYARTFLASLRTMLGRAAVRVGRYRDARKYFLLAFRANPFYRRLHPHLLASLGGRRTYESSARLRRKLQRLASVLP
ncbi:glycosyltransferase [Halovenus sp. WSH3]|uniref:Glycosyltransferase n=1 Tax=Halovenus carboxidivorans TaxID=2692199 RepID=A0A6B0TC61_9EURY|nr:glycosyltransferase family A protein [Halovenus carboxidivorans]MXR52992.1 glycosyltransferase [Halovenus carboxidivorans]